MNERMSEECTPLIRLYEHSLTVQPDAVLVLLLTGQDFFVGHATLLKCFENRALRAHNLSRLAREEGRKRQVLGTLLRWVPRPRY